MFSTNELLINLGWPSAEPDLSAKGTLTWQRPVDLDNLQQLPATASITVAPRFIRAKVLNILPSEQLEPHFEAEWGLDDPNVPVLTKFVYAGTALPLESATDSARAVEMFNDLLVLINQRPKLNVLGRRQKDTPSAVSGPATP